MTAEDEQRLSTDHAVTVLRFHVVLSTWRRNGVFGRAEAEAVADCWRKVQGQCPLFIEKVSFVPDHVHLAIWSHSNFSPAKAVVTLMNAAQELMWRNFANCVIKESAHAEERKLISGVLVNRLKKGMPLQMDPTVIYGLKVLIQAN